MASSDLETRTALRDLDAEILSITQQIQDQRLQSIRVDEQLLRRFQSRTKELGRQLAMANQSGQLARDQYQTYRETIQAARSFTRVQTQLNAKFKDLNKTALKVLQNMGGLGREIDNFIDRLPGGRALTRLFGVNDLVDSLEDAADTAMEAFTDSLANGATQSQAMSSAMQAFAANVNMAAIATAAFVALIAGALMALKSVVAQTAEIATNFQLTTGEAGRLAARTREIQSNSSNTLGTTEDLFALQKAVTLEFAGQVELTQSNLLTMTKINLELGIGAEKVGALVAKFMALGASQNDAVELLQVMQKEADIAGVSAAAVAEDIAQHSGEAAKYFGRSRGELVKAAAQARRMGMSLGDTVEIADTLLDIETSLASQFEYMAYTGKQINLDEARRLAFVGSTTKAAEELINQMEGLPDDPMGMRLATKLTGKTAEELQKIFATSVNIKGLTASERAEREAAQVAAENQAEAMKKMDASIDAIKNTFTQFLLPMGQAFASIFEGVLPVVRGLLFPFQVIAKVINYISEQIQLALESSTALQSVFNVIGAVVEVLASTFSGTLIPLLVVFAAKAAVAATKSLITAISGIYTSFAKLPFGAGIPLAAVAVGGLMGLINTATKVGDLAINPNGGPVVMSPREGGIYQGTRNDGVSMSPYHGGADTAGSGNGTSPALLSAIQRQNELLSQMLTALKNPPPVLIGTSQIAQMGRILETDNTYRAR